MEYYQRIQSKILDAIDNLNLFSSNANIIKALNATFIDQADYDTKPGITFAKFAVKATKENIKLLEDTIKLLTLRQDGYKKALAAFKRKECEKCNGDEDEDDEQD